MSLVSGGLVGVIGYFQPFLLIGSIFATIGAGLLYTLDIGSSSAQYIGYQIIVGIGIGTSIQVPVIAVQALSEMAEIPLVTADVLCMFTNSHFVPQTLVQGRAKPQTVFQLVSGALSLSVAQSLFANRLLASLPHYAPGVDPGLVLITGATEIRKVFAPDQVHGILLSYLTGLKAAWALSIASIGMAVLASFLPEFKSIRGGMGKATPG